METKILVLTVLAIIASGCTSNTDGSGNGLVVQQFSVSDSTLRPGQEANLKLILKNYHTEPTKINEITIFNEGALKISNKQCSSQDIRQARENLYPRLSCSWTVKAPGQEFIQGFNSKKTPIKLRVSYSTHFSNSRPLKINFKPLNEIQSSNTKKISFSNGEVAVTARADSPTAVSNPSPISITVRNSGPGRVAGDYGFSYTPSEVFNCPSTQKPVVDQKVEFSCQLESGTQGVRNLFITTSYKYVKSPNLDISVVNPQ